MLVIGMNWLYNRITDKELVDNLANSFLIRKEVINGINPDNGFRCDSRLRQPPTK